jgi:hypothetical protein
VPEYGWSNINPVASSTKEMGPGPWRDMLNDHFGDWNWKKVVGLGTSWLQLSTDMYDIYSQQVHYSFVKSVRLRRKKRCIKKHSKD